MNLHQLHGRCMEHCTRKGGLRRAWASPSLPPGYWKHTELEQVAWAWSVSAWQGRSCNPSTLAGATGCSQRSYGPPHSSHGDDCCCAKGPGGEDRHAGFLRASGWSLHRNLRLKRPLRAWQAVSVGEAHPIKASRVSLYAVCAVATASTFASIDARGHAARAAHPDAGGISAPPPWILPCLHRAAQTSASTGAQGVSRCCCSTTTCAQSTQGARHGDPDAASCVHLLCRQADAGFAHQGSSVEQAQKDVLDSIASVEVRPQCQACKVCQRLLTRNLAGPWEERYDRGQAGAV